LLALLAYVKLRKVCSRPVRRPAPCSLGGRVAARPWGDAGETHRFRDATGLACKTAATPSHPAAATSTPTPPRTPATTPATTPASRRIKSGSLTATNASAAIPSPSSTPRSRQGATILSCAGIHTAVIAMPDFFFEFLGRAAVMLPVILILVAVLWLVFNKRRHDTFAPAFSPSDMRTWSLRFALLDGAVFAITFALLSAWMADSEFSAGVAGGLAALVAMGLVPWLARRNARLSNR